jgi:peptidoglycan hydrolase CwlO-like protein
MDKKELEAILAKHAKNTDYKLEVIIDDVRVIKENVSSLRENVSDLRENVSDLQEKVDVIFDQAGNLTVDMATVKNVIEHHERKIGQL